MGFFDRDVKNGFDRMFDWNDDGKLDSFEQANQFEFECWKKIRSMMMKMMMTTT